jgi:HD-like signal output (HDOD) protein
MGLMERTSVGGEQAFTAGLFHDIGKLAFDQILHTEYVAAANESSDLNVPFVEIEKNHLPFSHTVLGEAIAMQWNLPMVITDCIAFHHEPGNAQLHPELAATVCLADELAQSIDSDGEIAGVSLDVFDALNPAACAVLGLQRREIQSLVDACRLELIKAKPLHDYDQTLAK